MIMHEYQFDKLHIIQLLAFTIVWVTSLFFSLKIYFFLIIVTPFQIPTQFGKWELQY